MVDASEMIRADVREMEAYEPIAPFEVLSRQLGREVESIVKLDANENPYGAHPAVRDALARMPFAHIYPDPESRELRSTLSKYSGAPFENLLAGAGADELIDLVMRLFLDAGDVVLNCPPTFGMYTFDARLNAGRVVSVPRGSDFSIDVDAIGKAVAESRAKLLFIATPNNPDGGMLSDDEFEALIKLPVVLVLDEAYVEFVAGEGGSRIAEVARRENLVVLRTFSKWAGLAGLRVGYGAFPASLMPHLWKIKQPYNVSVAASTAAIASLQHVDELRATVRRLIDERERLYRALCEVVYLRPYPTHGNFILCRVVGRDAKQLRAELARRGVLIRYFDKVGLRDHVRVSVGKPEHSDALLAVLHDET